MQNRSAELFKAIEKSDLDAIKLIIEEQKADPNTMINADAKTALFYATSIYAPLLYTNEYTDKKYSVIKYLIELESEHHDFHDLEKTKQLYALLDQHNILPDTKKI